MPDHYQSPLVVWSRPTCYHYARPPPVTTGGLIETKVLPLCQTTNSHHWWSDQDQCATTMPDHYQSPLARPPPVVWSRPTCYHYARPPPVTTGGLIETNVLPDQRATTMPDHHQSPLVVWSRPTCYHYARPPPVTTGGLIETNVLPLCQTTTSHHWWSGIWSCGAAHIVYLLYK